MAGTLRVTQEEYARLVGRPMQAPPRRTPSPCAGYDSKLERAYVLECIEPRVHAGEVLWWRYHPCSLILVPARDGDRALRYTPDFWMLLTDGSHHFYEVKGTERRRNMQMRSGTDRWKMAAEQYSWAHWHMLCQGKDGWETRRYRAAWGGQ